MTIELSSMPKAPWTMSVVFSRSSVSYSGSRFCAGRSITLVRNTTSGPAIETTRFSCSALMFHIPGADGLEREADLEEVGLDVFLPFHGPRSVVDSPPSLNAG